TVKRYLEHPGLVEAVQLAETSWRKSMRQKAEALKAEIARFEILVAEVESPGSMRLRIVGGE
ncbi:MAG: hypothetical protein HRT45_07450, partial [Bdellovibrionales bacterium]|nr:hypothetical protein [Bdellovibrionales bacterium]